MDNLVKNIVIVGGGSAGWLSAAIIAAERTVDPEAGITITLVESPNIATIGVGEGTWPSMRETLRRIGVSEAEFIAECDVSFKQGSKFVGWTAGRGEYYYHPFTLPEAYIDINLVPHWWRHQKELSFVDAVCPQGVICDKGLAPKQITTPEFARNLNYGYHLNAGKFSEFLRRHAVEKLGVSHVLDDVVVVESEPNGYISGLTLGSGKKIVGDLFVDCTGFSALLIGKHYKIPFIDKRNVLFNDTALAVPVPYPSDGSPISSCTIGTAQDNGWIWDIGLYSRRGVGHVFSSGHTTDEAAQQALKAYLSTSLGPKELEALEIRKIQFSSGFRDVFWHHNCVAIGLSAGFLEPLEATALVLIEQSAQMLAEQMPENRDVMKIIAKRFNKKFRNHWESAIDFLKLHYVLTRRTDTDYWCDQLASSSIPETLQELLILWEQRSPWVHDNIYREEMFPSASFQYVLYGMRPDAVPPPPARRHFQQEARLADSIFQANAIKINKLVSGLSANRELIEKIKKYGLVKT